MRNIPGVMMTDQNDIPEEDVPDSYYRAEEIWDAEIKRLGLDHPRNKESVERQKYLSKRYMSLISIVNENLPEIEELVQRDGVDKGIEDLIQFVVVSSYSLAYGYLPPHTYIDILARMFYWAFYRGVNFTDDSPFQDFVNSLTE
jgi:hypothetical protein